MGVVQVEVGVEASIGSGTNVFTFGQSLVRYGVGGIEIRIVPGSVLIAGDDRGAPDPSVGLKVPLSSGDGPRFSAVLATTLPVGSEAFSEGEASGAATLVAEFTLSDAFGLAFNAGYSFPFEHVGDGAVGVVVTPGLSITASTGSASTPGTRVRTDLATTSTLQRQASHMRGAPTSSGT